MLNTVLVMAGAGLGGGCRHGVNVLFGRFLPGLGFPAATLVINLAGSFLIGVLAEVFALRGGVGHPLRLFLMTGVLGGFTTFSSFSLDAVALYERGAVGSAAVYVLLSVAGGIAGLVLALALTRWSLGGVGS